MAEYATYGSTQLADNVVAALAGGRTAALMANHGSIAYAETMAKACDRLQLLEWLCQHYVQALQIGTPSVLDRQQLGDVIDAFLTDNYADGPQRVAQ